MKVVVMILVCVGAVYGDNLAPFITPCHSSDLECLKKSSQSAIAAMSPGRPELGVQPFDPMKIDRIAASQAGLDMDFKNTVVKGLRNCIVMNLRVQPSKMIFEVKCSVQLIGDYKLGGRLLVLPIEGNGKYKIKIRDIVVKMTLDMSEVTRDGEVYWSVPNFKYTSDLQTGAEFHFQNLFNGNKQLSDTIHQFANTNWRDIFQEVAPPIVKAVVAGIVNETKKFFSKIPKKYLILD